MRHHGFSCSSLYTVTPEQAQENLLIENLPVGKVSGSEELLNARALPHTIALLSWHHRYRCLTDSAATFLGGLANGGADSGGQN